MLLRDEFEPLCFAPRGYYPNAKICRSLWDECDWAEVFLLEQVGRADEWLSQQGQIQRVNKKIGDSYSIKHVAEAWHRRKIGQREGTYISNGCLLMAALSLGV